MINSTTGALAQTVEAKEAILFSVDRVRSRRCDRGCGGWLYHDNGSGQFQIVNDRQCNAVFKIDFNGNVGPVASETATTPTTGASGTSAQASTASADTASATTVKYAIMLNGEAIGGTEMVTEASAGKLENVSASTLITVPHSASVTITVDNLSGASTSVEDGNIIITKIA